MKNNFEKLLLSAKEELVQESVLDTPKKSLSKEIFDKNLKVKERFRKEALDIFNDWKERFIPKAQIKGVYLIGSTTSYQYNDTSDFDVNVYTDLPDNNIRTYGRMLPNGSLLTGTRHPINFYLANETNAIDKSPALYDLVANSWIREPKKDSIKVPHNYVLEVARFFISGVENRITEYEIDSKELEFMKNDLKDKDSEIDKEELTKRIAQKEEEIKADLDAISIAHKLIRAFRQEAFKEDYEPSFLIDIKMSGNPNKSVNNLIYKEFERLGFFNKLEKYEKIRDEIWEKENE